MKLFWALSVIFTEMVPHEIRPNVIWCYNLPPSPGVCNPALNSTDPSDKNSGRDMFGVYAMETDREEFWNRIPPQ